MAKALTLIGISGSRVGQSTVLEARNSVVGAASSCDVVMQDRLIMPRHAELRVTLDRWFIRPLDPKATVFVNGEPVTAQQRLETGDLVTMGTATFKAALGAVGERQVGGSTRW
jgi:pSer/pThr/pTyr-binding forkhead associated (FHA) protein